MTQDSEKRSILVTSALPYANAPLHLGHIIEHTQTDIWVRFQRLYGNECTYVCADDAHGTPIMLKAEELKCTPEKLVEDIYVQHKSTFKDYRISHDNFHTTHSEENRILSERIYNSLNEDGLIEKKIINQLFDTEREMFLSDRYVKGSCPNCGAIDQYGDNCEKCSATYNAIDLKDPISVLTGSVPIIKESEHLFFKLSSLKTQIIQWLDNSRIQESVRNKLNEWLDGELKDWDISRDSPYFGFKIPGYEDKFFYVWLDAPIGYLASHLNYLKNKDLDAEFEDFWNPNSDKEIYHFIGKDIMYFHALFFPMMLSNSDFKTPNGLFVHGFLTLNGEKMSKSRGNFISAENYIENLDPDYLRYFFATKLGIGVDDIDLNLEDFKQKTNSDLVNKYANIASRTAKFINKYYDNKLADELDSPEILDEFIEVSSKVAQFYENLELSKATREIMSLADKANQYVDSKEPWVLIKQEGNEQAVQSICTTAINLFRILTIMLHPIIPGFTNQATDFLNEKDISWGSINKALLGTSINTFKPIIMRIEEEQISNLLGN
ncbi:MAG: methionine--tRNA ligase [Gammaproteobacteria bacterium]